MIVLLCGLVLAFTAGHFYGRRAAIREIGRHTENAMRDYDRKQLAMLRLETCVNGLAYYEDEPDGTQRLRFPGTPSS